MAPDDPAAHVHQDHSALASPLDAAHLALARRFSDRAGALAPTPSVLDQSRVLVQTTPSAPAPLLPLPLPLPPGPTRLSAFPTNPLVPRPGQPTMSYQNGAPYAQAPGGMFANGVAPNGHMNALGQPHAPMIGQGLPSVAGTNGQGARRTSGHGPDEQQLAYQYQQQQARQSAPHANPFAGTALARTGGPSMPGGAAALQQQQALLRQQAAGAPAPRPPHTPSSGGSISLAAPTDGGPPFNVPLLGMFTRTSQLAPGAPFPAITKEDQVRVKAWMAKDTTYEKDIMAVKRARKGEFQEIAEDVMRSQDWLGAESGGRTRLKIKMDADRTKERERGKRGNNRREVKLTKDGVRAIAKLPEILIPVRLEYEHEAYKLRDTFTWNLRETLVTPEIFASHLCEDLRLPYHPFYKEIVAQIKRHLEEAVVTEDYVAHIGDNLAEIREDNREWFESERKRRRVGDAAMADDEPGPVTLREIAKVESTRDEELRVLIKLDITLDSFQLIDRFEWDISDPYNSPEEFAEVFVADLGLGGEFRTAVAHAIREQIDVYVKSLCLLGHVTGHPVPDDDLRREFLPPLFEPFRAEVGEFQPVLSQLSPDEIERNDKEREREVRRKRRQTKGRGVTLPDRDPVKTHRTLVPKPNTAPLHSYQDQRGDMVYPMPDMSRPFPIERPNIGDKPPPPTRPAPMTPADRIQPPGNVLVQDGLLGAGTGARLRRLRVGDHAGSADLAASGTPSDANARATTPQPTESRSHHGPGKNSPAANKMRKQPPVIQASLEELGLHEHLINGQWFCANCGVPDALAVGRRKGLSGHNTLCGACGKFFHRYRRNRPCEYTTDLSAHQRSKKASDSAPKVSHAANEIKTRKSATASAAQPQASTSQRQNLPEPSKVEDDDDDDDEDDDDEDEPLPQTRGRPSRQSRESSEDSNASDSSSVVSNAAPVTRATRGTSVDLPYVDVASPDSGLSSASPSPPPMDFAPAAPEPAVAAPPPPTPPAAIARLPAVDPLPWMVLAAAELRSNQVDDRFEIIPRGRPTEPSLQEWRIRCLDCPGKLYNLGPGETLTNFAVHFKNRQHRANVEARIRGGP